jgi:signal transduction histidine kinase
VGRKPSSAPLVVVIGFFVGLFLASMDHILPTSLIEQGPWHWLAFIVDWIAPPLAGVLLAGALLYAQRARKLHAAEQAAAQVLAERLAGTERRQAVWVIAAAVAHDVKNPLHNLALLVEELSDEKDPTARDELIRRIRENVTRASDRLSELSRAGKGQEGADQIVDLAGALEMVRERLTPTLQESAAVLHIECPRGLSVRGDAHAVRSAVENVAANALEALQDRGPGGKLSLRAARKDGVVELVVQDDGPGVPEQLQPRLFSPFATGDGGSGLGLAIARALARAGGGDLIFAGSVGGRTTFRFTFQSA